MQFHHVFASCHLMQPINVLGNDPLQTLLLLQHGQICMGSIGACISQQMCFIILVEKIGMCIEKSSAQYLFRRIQALHFIQPVFSPEILQTAFCGYSCAAKEHNALFSGHDPFQRLYLILHTCLLLSVQYYAIFCAQTQDNWYIRVIFRQDVQFCTTRSRNICVSCGMVNPVKK